MVWACAAKRSHLWVKKCMKYEMECIRPRDRPKRTWSKVVQTDCEARKLNRGMPWILIDGGS